MKMVEGGNDDKDNNDEDIDDDYCRFSSNKKENPK